MRAATYGLAAVALFASLTAPATAQSAAPAYGSGADLEVVRYELRARIEPAAHRLGGEAMLRLRTPRAISTVGVDLVDAMQVDAVAVDGVAATFTHQHDLIAVTLPRGWEGGHQGDVRIRFSGSPADGTFAFGEHADVAVAASNGLPYSARNRENRRARSRRLRPQNDRPLTAAPVLRKRKEGSAAVEPSILSGALRYSLSWAEK